MQEAAVLLVDLAEEDRLAKHGAENALGPIEGARDTAVPFIKVVNGDEPPVGDCRLQDGIEPRFAVETVEGTQPSRGGSHWRWRA